MRIEAQRNGKGSNTMPSPKLSESWSRHSDAFFGFCPKAHELRRLCPRFDDMLRWRRAKKLNNWIDQSSAVDNALPE
jgi:hypothetical protein